MQSSIFPDGEAFEYGWMDKSHAAEDQSERPNPDARPLDLEETKYLEAYLAFQGRRWNDADQLGSENQTLRGFDAVIAHFRLVSASPIVRNELRGH
ncbi:hypothetical protein GG851_10535 [Bordetella petrii]|nr:hypothetical protein [Bordetella petrii]